jgi:flagellar secretion chaperone FliS
MSGYGSAGAHYLRDTVETATPATRLVMLYDRLVTDLMRAEAAIVASPTDFETANSTLQHAQEIICLLDSTLDITVWEGASKLRALYQWTLGLLLRANLTKDASLVRDCRATIEPLRDAWRGAGLAIASNATAQAVSYVA